MGQTTTCIVPARHGAMCRPCQAGAHRVGGISVGLPGGFGGFEAAVIAMAAIENAYLYKDSIRDLHRRAL